MENIEIARIFEDVADLLEMLGASVFRIRAYRAAARTVETLGTPAESLLKKDGNALEALPGIGKDLAGKIREIIETGELTLLKELTVQIPESVIQMIRIPGLGPKRAKQIYDQLGIATLAGLEQAAREGRLRALRGWKETMEAKVLQGIADLKAWRGRFWLIEADAAIRPLLERLEATQEVTHLQVAGSYRRRRETVGDVDLLVTATAAEPVMERFLSAPEVKQVLAHGDTKSSIVLRQGLQVDLRVVGEESLGAALHYFTGSKAHNIAVRTLGVKRGVKINEYGIFRGSRRIAGRHEADVFQAVGLPWIPPELREDRGESAAAFDGQLPTLVERGDIRGDLQMHTTYTDGRDSLADMVKACGDRGYSYIAITDHTKAVRVAGGLSREEFQTQFREIDEIRKTGAGPAVLKSAEVDILDAGQLDLDDETLAELDLVVVSVHSKFNMTKADMTQRVVRALRHPRVHVFAHPTGRLIGRREPYPLDMEEVVLVAHDCGVLLEVNAQPDRLDLNDTYCQMARDAGVKLVISTDAHRIAELDNMRYGVDQARRGWCEPADIANTRSLDAFLKLIAK